MKECNRMQNTEYRIKNSWNDEMLRIMEWWKVGNSNTLTWRVSSDVWSVNSKTSPKYFKKVFSPHPKPPSKAGHSLQREREFFIYKHCWYILIGMVLIITDRLLGKCYIRRQGDCFRRGTDTVSQETDTVVPTNDDK